MSTETEKKYTIRKQMSIKEAVKLIQCHSSSKSSTTGKVFKSNFGVKSTFTVEDDNFQTAYLEILSLIKKSNKNYYKDLRNNEDFKSVNYGLPFMEKALDGTSSVVIDFLFRFNECDAADFLDFKLIPSLVQKVQDVLLTTCKIDVNDAKEMICFALKSGVWTEDKEERQRVVLIFPGAKVDRNILNDCIINLLIEDLKAADIFKFFHQTPIVADWTQIVKRTTEFFPMYGCKEFEIESPALLYKIYKDLIEDDFKHDFTEQDEEEYLVSLEDFERFNPFESQYFIRSGLDVDEFQDFSRRELLPVILSLNYPVQDSKYNHEVLKLKGPEPKREAKRQEKGFTKKMDQQELFDELIPLISKDRFTKENKYYWYTIGKCCYNIFRGTAAGLQKFKNLTPPELEGDIKNFWYNLEREFLDIRTVMEYARQDNPEEYKKWNRNFYYPLVERCITSKGKDIPMARLSKRILCTDYVYCRSDKIWHRKCASILKRDLGALDLKNDLIDLLQEVFIEEYKLREAAKDDAKGPEERKILAARCRDVEAILDKLDTGSYIEVLIKSLQSELYDDNFSKYKDEDLKLLGCTNVILEVYDDTICHRPGKLQDYVTKCTDIAFPTSYDDDNVKVKFLEEYYSQVHTDPEMYHFFMKDMASYLVGGNEEKYFRNFIGERNASKSKVVELLQRALGPEYCVDFPSESICITRGKSSGGPDPALEQAKGARLAIVSESSKSEPLSVVKIKKYTGNDRYWNRSLNKEGGSRALTFKLIHMSNVIAAVPDADKGYRCREVIYPFTSQWVPRAPKTKAEQYRQRKFKMDTKFSDKIRTMGQAQLYLMFRYFPIYRKEGIKKLPKIVKDETMKHHREIDPFYNFMNHKIDRFYNFPTKDTRDRLKKKKKVSEDSDEDEDEYDSDFSDEVDDSESEDEVDDKDAKRKELYTYLDTTKKTSVNEVFNAYGRWYSRFCPDTPLSLTQADFLKEMKRDDRLGPVKKGYWMGLTLRNSGRNGGKKE